MEETAERFIDWAEEVDESSKHRRKRIFFLVATIAALVWFFITAIPIFLVVTPIFFIIFLFFYMFKNKTYDFSLNGDIFRASVLHNQRRRRRKMKFPISDIRYIVMKVEQHKNMKYYCAKDSEEELCTMVVNYKGQEIALVSMAYEDFLDIVRNKVREG